LEIARKIHFYFDFLRGGGEPEYLFWDSARVSSEKGKLFHENFALICFAKKCDIFDK